MNRISIVYSAAGHWTDDQWKEKNHSLSLIVQLTWIGSMMTSSGTAVRRATTPSTCERSWGPPTPCSSPAVCWSNAVEATVAVERITGTPAARVGRPRPLSNYTRWVLKLVNWSVAERDQSRESIKKPCVWVRVCIGERFDVHILVKEFESFSQLWVLHILASPGLWQRRRRSDGQWVSEHVILSNTEWTRGAHTPTVSDILLRSLRFSKLHRPCFCSLSLFVCLLASIVLFILSQFPFPTCGLIM